MLNTQTLQRRPWAGLGGLVTIFIGLLLAFANIYLGILVVALALLGMAAILFMPARMAPSAHGQSRKAVARFAPSAAVQRVVYTADGEPRAAIVVPAEVAGGYTTVLTSEGYKLVNDAGQIVYTLK